MRRVVVVCCLAWMCFAGTVAAAGWKAGVAKVNVTPKKPIWMAGYAARNRPSEGVLHDLWVKALAIEDPSGKRVMLVTLEVCGVSRPWSVEVRDLLKSRFGLERDAIVLSCSHSHCGPVVGTNLITMYPLDAAQRKVVDEYAATLRDGVIDAAGQALDALRPAELHHDLGRCSTFAFNRRENDQGRVPELRKRISMKGPDDHDVPVLRVRDDRGQITAVAFGFACHCTTLDFYKLCNDYAGFAQLEIEKAHPGAIALFWAGCGADQNPLPRGTVELAEKYGKDLARSVEQVLARPMHPLTTNLHTAYREIDLEFGPMPGKDEWESRTKSDNRFEAERAKFLLARIEKDGKLAPTYPYPVQIWKWGDQLTWIFLGGEVVVDYSLRLKRSLGSDTTWVACYCNDVMAYIPSLRVLKEGGYEGGGAMLYYAMPSPWSERVEEHIIETVAEMAAGH